MANTYLAFSQIIENLGLDEYSWLKLEATKFNEQEFAFEWEISDGEFWFYAEDSGNVDDTANFVQKFLQKFRPTDAIVISYAYYCSKPRIDSAGGGAVLVTAPKIYVMDGMGMAYEKLNELKNVGEVA